MGFREKEITSVVILKSPSADTLCIAIQEMLNTYDVIDLQYSTTNIHAPNMNEAIEYSALALLGKQLINV